MKIIAIFGDGSNQRALAHKIHQSVPLDHIARVRTKPKGRRKIVRAIVSLTLARGLRNAWTKMNRHYDIAFPDWPHVPSSLYPTANAEELIQLIECEKPNLLLISGTDLVRREVLERFAAPAMNLHTGISPYIRGGPNCTNWALALREFDLIGNTVMWIDPGIDSGSIITTERTSLDGRETLTELHIKVMEHAHDLYRRTVEAFVAGREIPSVRQQSIGGGRLFLTRQWNGAAMLRAVINHKLHYRPFENRSDIRLVDLR